uniref:Uncharacterized protein n=1 Tax=Spongospora subterranea TaxID=70186 RepID=A0A0H5QEP1_9EUKA|eukprot:CRZ00518.1 hypothetical protein [Spongospora subterranea]
MIALLANTIICKRSHLILLLVHIRVLSDRGDGFHHIVGYANLSSQTYHVLTEHVAMALLSLAVTQGNGGVRDVAHALGTTLHVFQELTGVLLLKYYHFDDFLHWLAHDDQF